ncbi:MAG: hypothetical protein O2960_25565 [Verrucomicrobia bacterium]|nr:hypothetical protein [Verrucomicrobiota bacterium]
MPRAEQSQLDDAQQINKTLVTFNCIAFHERAGLGGIAPERNALFTGTPPALGDIRFPFPQDQGYQSRGYHLDAARRPTFSFHYGDIDVEDSFEDVRDGDGRAYFKRTLCYSPLVRSKIPKAASGGP